MSDSDNPSVEESARLLILEYRVGALEGFAKDVRDSILSIDRTFQRTVSLEAKHDDHRNELQALRNEFVQLRSYVTKLSGGLAVVIFLITILGRPLANMIVGGA